MDVSIRSLPLRLRVFFRRGRKRLRARGQQGTKKTRFFKLACSKLISSHRDKSSVYRVLHSSAPDRVLEPKEVGIGSHS